MGSVVMDNDKISSVKLKGVNGALCITINPNESANNLQEEIGRQLGSFKYLGKNARIVIDTGDDSSHDDLIGALTNYLKTHFGINSVSKSHDKKHSEHSSDAQRWIHKTSMKQSWHNYSSDTILMMGRVRSGQKVTAKKHLILLGDINPGAEVVAGGDILIMGSLLGSAMAGQPDNDGSIVLALDFRPTQIQIGGYVAAGIPSSPERITEFAHVENGTIIVENYLEANPFSRLPLPQVR